MKTNHRKLLNQFHSTADGHPTRRRAGFGLAALLAAAALALGPATMRAVPSFARQLNMQCTACHTSFPMLNQFGRTFKLTGYTDSADDANLPPPLAAMLMPSFTNTSAPQVGGAAPGFGENNNTALTQASIFYAGRLFGPYAKSLFGSDGATVANKFGIFAQVTYDGVGKAWSWDNMELRFADKAEISGRDVVYGAYLNNNPTLQDPWNSTPAFGFPFTGSGLAPGPDAATLIEGGLSQQVGGLGIYAMVDGHFYFDVGGYLTLPAHIQRALGVDPAGETQLSSLAPYWRFAYERPAGEGRWEIGTFGLAASTYPGRDSSAGTDRLTDFGFDTQYQLSTTHGDFALMASWIHENQSWDASAALGNTANLSGSLDSFKATASYLHNKTYGLTVQYFSITGSGDATLFSGSATGSPNSDGFVFQLDYLPFNKGTGPAVWPRSNVKFTLQYTNYNRFNGGSTNYDGAGANASDNNTLYLEAWIAF
jgi:hypothetical protein